MPLVKIPYLLLLISFSLPGNMVTFSGNPFREFIVPAGITILCFCFILLLLIMWFAAGNTDTQAVLCHSVLRLPFPGASWLISLTLAYITSLLLAPFCTGRCHFPDSSFLPCCFSFPWFLGPSFLDTKPLP